MTHTFKDTHKLALVFLLFVFGGFDGIASSLAQDDHEHDKGNITGEPYKPTIKAPDSLVMLTRDKLYYRPDISWGFRLDLTGFNDLSKVGLTRSRVAFGVREDSVGMTLSQLFITKFSRKDEGTSSGYFSDKRYADIVVDTAVITGSIRRDTLGIFQIIEYDKNEIWPQKDRENPEMSFDSFLVRKHFSAITSYGETWLHLHLSKTDYRSFDSTIFVDILATFELIDPLPLSPKQR